MIRGSIRHVDLSSPNARLFSCLSRDGVYSTPSDHLRPAPSRSQREALHSPAVDGGSISLNLFTCAQRPFMLKSALSQHTPIEVFP
jgi:hypothetical protein